MEIDIEVLTTKEICSTLKDAGIDDASIEQLRGTYVASYFIKYCIKIITLYFYPYRK